MDKTTQYAIGTILILISVLYYLRSDLYFPFLSHRNDFAHLYLSGYLAQRGGNFFNPELMLRTHHVLNIPTGLNPFVYPPFFALILIPLSWFSYNTAWTLFFIASQAAYIASIYFMIQLLRKDHESPWLWWGGLLATSAASFPLARSFSAGQMNSFLLFFLVCSWYFHSRNKNILAGIILGLGAAIKVSPAFLLIYFIVKRQWKVSCAGIITTAITLVISVLFMGWDVHNDFISEARQMSYGSSTWASLDQHYHVEPHNQAPSALWYRLFTNNPSTTGFIDSPLVAKSLSIITALIIILALLAKSSISSPQTSLIEYCLWLIGMLLIPSLMWDHYLVQAMLPIAVALRLSLDNTTKGIWMLGFGIGLILIPFWYDNPAFKEGWATLLIPIKLYGLILLSAYLCINSPNSCTQTPP